MPACGWSRAVRLRKSADFERVQRHGKRIVGQHLLIVHLHNVVGPRFGLAVSRKVGNAVVRNRVKRWLRQALRLQQAQAGPRDVVVVARPSAATAGYPALYREVGAALASFHRSPPETDV